MSGHVAVLGAGSWGTAFAKILADAGRDVTIWARRQPIADVIRTERRNPEYLPDVVLPDRVTGTGDAAEAIKGAEMVVLAVPSQTLRGNLAEWVSHLHADATLVSLMKGIELGTTKRMSEVIIETAQVAADRVVVVSGPNLAPEIAAEQPAATVVACTDVDRATLVQRSITTPYFRPYTNDDVIGCELGGAVKNVIALAYGIATAMGFGHNTRAMLVTRGWPKPPGSGWRWARTRSPSPAWPAWVIWWPPARRRRRATAPSVSTWAGAPRWRRRGWPPGRPPRGSRARWPSATWPARTAWRCRSPSRSSWSVTRASTRGSRYAP